MTYEPRTTSHPDIAAIVEAERQIERWKEVLQERVNAARDNGFSWQTIGDGLGISRQAAHERFSLG